jgi:uncharacterized membrane protein YfcA
LLELSPFFFALTIPAILFSGISKGGIGAGAGFAITPLLALVLEPAAVLGLMLPLLILMDFAAIGPYRRAFSRHEAGLLILGGLPGVILGAAFFSYANPDLLRVMIGVVALGFVVFQLARRLGYFGGDARKFGPVAGIVAGVAAGFTSFVSHAGAPPAAIYLLTRDLSKTAYQATTVVLFWAINLMKLGFYVGLGIFSADILKADLILAPIALVGVWAGVKLHHRIPQAGFFKLTYVALTLTGAKLIWDGLV